MFNKEKNIVSFDLDSLKEFEDNIDSIIEGKVGDTIEKYFYDAFGNPLDILKVLKKLTFESEDNNLKIKEYLNSSIKYWRKSKENYAKYYIDAFLSIHMSLFGYYIDSTGNKIIEDEGILSKSTTNQDKKDRLRIVLRTRLDQYGVSEHIINKYAEDIFKIFNE